MYTASAFTGIELGTLRVWLHREERTRHSQDRQGLTLLGSAQLQPTILATDRPVAYTQRGIAARGRFQSLLRFCVPAGVQRTAI